MKLLIVDDEDKMLKLLSLILSEEFELTTASSAKEAFNKFLIDPFDVILSDIKMPKEDGISLMKKVKEKDPDIPFILITGHGDKKTAVDALKFGAFDFIEKPFDEEVLKFSLRRAMHFRKAQAQNNFTRSVLRKRNIEIQNLTREISLKEDQNSAVLAGGVIHEIRTPLNVADFSIKKIITELKNEDLDKEKIIELSEKTSKMIERTFKTISGMQSIVDCYSYDEPMPEKVTQIISDVYDLVIDGFNKANVELNIENPFVHETIQCQFVPISQILINLLNNARRAAAESDEKKVQLDIKDLNEKIEFSVTDSGKGIPQKLKEKIFEPFFTTYKDNHGTGLGLSICKTIAEKHSGTLELDENSVKTRFVLQIAKE